MTKESNGGKNSKNYRTRKFLTTNLIRQTSDNEDELQFDPSSEIYLSFIFKPEDKIHDFAFENKLSVLKKSKENQQ